jgi:hypothetical protein
MVSFLTWTGVVSRLQVATWDGSFSDYIPAGSKSKVNKQTAQVTQPYIIQLWAEIISPFGAVFEDSCNCRHSFFFVVAGSSRRFLYIAIQVVAWEIASQHEICGAVVISFLTFRIIPRRRSLLPALLNLLGLKRKKRGRGGGYGTLLYMRARNSCDSLRCQLVRQMYDNQVGLFNYC